MLFFGNPGIGAVDGGPGPLVKPVNAGIKIIIQDFFHHAIGPFQGDFPPRTPMGSPVTAVEG